MAMTADPRRELQAFAIVMFISALLLLLFDFRGSMVSAHGLTAKQNSRQLPIETVHASATGHVPTVGLPSARQDLALNFSSTLADEPISKRAPVREPRGYRNLVCAGENYLEAIKAAFEGRTPVKKIPLSELNNGWTRQNTYTEDDQFNSIQRRWRVPFEALFGQEQGYPPQKEIKPIDLIQDQPYQTLLGVEIKEPTVAYSFGFYYPSRNLMMSTSSHSAVEKITDRFQGISKDNRNAKLPTVSALSDLMWLAWNIAAPPAPQELRYIARDVVNNDETSAVMNYLFARDSADPRNVPWPGLEYSGDSDEGKALLATPNGRATAWLLIDHAGEMDWRVPSRQLKVNIFSVFGSYCMLWDMEPQSPRGTVPHRRKLKRADGLGDDDFYFYKDKGDVAYNEIEAALTGCARNVRDYEPSAFQNGWTRVSDIKEPLSPTWARVLRDLGSPATQDTTFYVEMKHDKDFTNNQGQPVAKLPRLWLNAELNQFYIPSSSAIIVDNIISPDNEVKKYYGRDRSQAVPSNQEINDRLVPPLHRWSDATWTLWKEKGGAGNLRYIGHDLVANADTESVMHFIIDEADKEASDLPFPGLAYGMDSPQGRALLGTPNGIGAARLLIDRAATLGRREIRIHIFWPDGNANYPCMLIDMAPT